MRINGLEKYFKVDDNGRIIDFKQVNRLSLSPLMYAFLYNKSENFNLSKEQWDYLIKNSDLKQVCIDGWSPLIYALENNNEENLNLSSEKWKYLIDNSDCSLIKDKEQLLELLNNEILNKINISKEIKRNHKI